MSLSDELNDFFATSEQLLIQHPLLFKARLGIGEKAYSFLRYRENLTTFSEALGVGSAASAVASSGAVASTFFGGASSSFVASALSTLGLGSFAVTPTGWVVAAGLIAGGAYVGVTRLFESPKKGGLVVVPKYINTPLEVLGAALLELTLPISLKIAAADGEISNKERLAIIAHYVDEWGFNQFVVERLFSQYEDELDQVSYSKLVSSLIMYTESSADCDRDAILHGVLQHLREVAEADGRLHEQELAALKYISENLLGEAEKMGIGSNALVSLKKSLDALSIDAKAGADKLAKSAGSLGSRLGAGLQKIRTPFKPINDGSSDPLISGE